MKNFKFTTMLKAQPEDKVSIKKKNNKGYETGEVYDIDIDIYPNNRVSINYRVCLDRKNAKGGVIIKNVDDNDIELIP